MPDIDQAAKVHLLGTILPSPPPLVHPSKPFINVKTVILCLCLCVTLPMEVSRRLKVSTEYAARMSCQSMLSQRPANSTSQLQQIGCERWHYNSDTASECLRTLTSGTADPQVIYFEGDSRLLYMMHYLTGTYFKLLPKKNFWRNLSKGKKAAWHLKFTGYNFSTLNLEIVWRRARMIEHTAIEQEVVDALKEFLGDKVPLLALYNLALDVNYPNRTQSEFGPVIKKKFRHFASKSLQPWANITNVIWLDGPPVQDAVFNSRIRSLNQKMRTVLRDEYPNVLIWPTMWHNFEELLTRIGKKKVFTPDQIHLRDAANEVCAQIFLNVLCNHIVASQSSDYLCCTNVTLPVESIVILWISIGALGAIFVALFC